MTITDIHISPIKESRGLIAFASITLDDSMQLSGIAIHRKKDETGYRLTYPTKKVQGHDRYIFHPIEPTLSKEFEKSVIDAYQKNCNPKNSNAGHGSAQHTDKSG